MLIFSSTLVLSFVLWSIQVHQKDIVWEKQRCRRFWLHWQNEMPCQGTLMLGWIFCMLNVKWTKRIARVAVVQHCEHLYCKVSPFVSVCCSLCFVLVSTRCTLRPAPHAAHHITHSANITWSFPNDDRTSFLKFEITTSHHTLAFREKSFFFKSMVETLGWQKFLPIYRGDSTRQRHNVPSTITATSSSSSIFPFLHALWSIKPC